MSQTRRLTTAQATIAFLQQQYVERDGAEHLFFGGCFGIFGHGNVGGIGQALFEQPSFRYYQSRNEQAMVHTAIAYAKVRNRLGAFVCTSSIGPGATNMVTGAATATINRLPVLLLPGDIFSTRMVDPVLQQLESSSTNDISVNDCFKPVSKYWDRINRPEQVIPALLKAMRILTSPEETGAVTLCMPQDVQAEAFDFPESLFEKRVWHIPRNRPDINLLHRAVDIIKNAKRPVIIAGGGVIYSGATEQLKSLTMNTWIPVVETYAGKGSLPYDVLTNLGAAGVTGTPGAIAICEEADLVIGIGTRYSDFTSISQSAFHNKEVKFININVTAFDAYKQQALPLIGDAKVVLEEVIELLEDHRINESYRNEIIEHHNRWESKVDEVYNYMHGVPVSQGEVIGAVNSFSQSTDIVVCAAGSLPGDLHKLWRTRDSKGFHLEYGYSCMGYEIAGGLGAKMADPSREIYVMVGDGSYLMMAQEIVTSIQEGLKLTIILINNDGYASIGGLSRSLGTEAFGTSYRYRNKEEDQLNGKTLPVDLATNAESLGAVVIRTESINDFKEGLEKAKRTDRTTVIYIETDKEQRVDGYAWWDVPVSQVSNTKAIEESFNKLSENRKQQRHYIKSTTGK